MASGVLLVRHITGVSAASTITVDSATDDGTGCTLREAIQSSNTDTAVGGCTAGSGTGDTIEFDIAGAGPHTITPTSALPDITQSVIIDGYTETGASANTNPAPQALNGTLMIEIDLSSAGAPISITGSDVTVRGLVVNGAVGNALQAFSGGINARFEGNYIGTSVNGLAADANGSHGIMSQVSGPVVGGTDPEDRNLISGNTARGVQFQTDAADNGVIQGNLIGTNATGNAAIGNGTGGILVTGGDNTQIGGTTSGAQNVVSGNSSSGIALIEGSITNTVQGNYIGIGNDGSTDLGNSADGLVVQNNSGNTIGGNTSAARNIVSGNGSAGISTGASDNNTIQGNYVGLNAAGTATVANDGRGIYLYQSSGAAIGGTTTSTRNVIAGNSEGISMEE